MNILKLDTELKDKIITARIELLSQHPFFGQLAQYLYPTATDSIETAAVDGESQFLINPKFGMSCNINDMLFVVVHETMHLATSTHSRFPEYGNKQIWNIASDIAINYIILNKDHGAGIDLPREDLIVPLYKGFEKYWGLATEEIYYRLLKESKDCPVCNGSGSGESGNSKSGGSGQPGSSRSHSGDCPFKGFWVDESGSMCGSAEGMTEDQVNQWKRRISNAAAQARQAGNLPGALDYFVTDLLQPKKNWKRELRMETCKALRRRYDWKRISRRTAGIVRTPGQSPYLPSALLYMDTSGSMSDNDLREAINEMAEIVRIAGGRATLILGDAEIYYSGEISLKELSKLPVQRGGTNFIPLFEHIEEKKLKPSVLVGFSDLEGPFPACTPDFPVIWCRPKGWKAKAPFGRIIDIEN